MKAKLLIFDLDGTLVHSVADLTTAVNLTLRDLELPPLGQELVARHIGSGTRHLLISVLKKNGRENVSQALELFHQHYLNHLAEETHLYPGIMNALEELEGCEKVILTNKMCVFLEPLLAALEIRKYFTAVYGLESFATSKPDPGPLYEIARLHNVRAEDMLLIGDTESDIKAGKAAGILTCGVKWGYGDPEVLSSLAPERWASHPAELITLLEEQTV